MIKDIASFRKNSFPKFIKEEKYEPTSLLYFLEEALSMRYWICNPKPEMI